MLDGSNEGSYGPGGGGGGAEEEGGGGFGVKSKIVLSVRRSVCERGG